MSYVESPGIRRVIPSRYVVGEKPLKTNPNVVIEDLTSQNLPEYLSFMAERKPRPDGYYQKALEDPKHWTVFLMRDVRTGKMVGGLEGEMFKREDPALTPDPIAVAFVNHVEVDESVKGERIAPTGLMEFRRRAIQAGMDFWMGNVLHSNHASLKSSARTGRREPYFRKLDPEGEGIWGPSNWYHEPLGVLPEGSERVVETDYLSPDDLLVARLAERALNEGGKELVILAPVLSTNGDRATNKRNVPFYNIISPNPSAREDFQAVTEAIAGELLNPSGEDLAAVARWAVRKRSQRRSIVQG